MRRPLWLDEVVSQLIANDPRGIWHAMRSGADFQPPLHYALVRFADALAGGPSSFATRLPSLVASALTLFALAAALRASLSVAATLAGVLVLAAHPLFLAQAVEARAYALWILATALTAEALREERASRSWLLAAAAAALCTTHYFGVLSLAAIVIGAGVAGLMRGTPWGGVARALVPLAAGVAALLALLPLARTQLAATGGHSWVPPATFAQFADFLSFPWGWRPAARLIVAGVLVAAVRRIPLVSARWPRVRQQPLGVTIAALLATAVVPLLVVAVSVLYKPVLVLRYAAPATLAVATLAALAVEAFPSPARWLAVLLLVRATLFSFESTASGAHASTVLLAGERDAVGRLSARGIPTVSPFRHDAYRASLPTAGVRAVAWVVVPDSVIDRAAVAPQVGLSRESLLVERGFGRAVQHTFDFPAVVTLEQARSDTAVALLRDPSQAVADSIWFPGRRPCAISNRLVVFAIPAAALRCDVVRADAQAAPRP